MSLKSFVVLALCSLVSAQADDDVLLNREVSHKPYSGQDIVADTRQMEKPAERATSFSR
jgi:hypothetical protein